MFCSNCGKEISEMGKFCEHCGSALGEDEIQRFDRKETILTQQRQNTIKNTYQNIADHQEKKSKKIFVLNSILVVLGLIVAFLFYNIFMGTEKPENTIAKLEKALNELDIISLIDCFGEDAQEVFCECLGLDETVMEYLDMDTLAAMISEMENEEMYEFSMDVIDVDYSGRNDCIITVDTEIHYDGEKKSGEIEFPMEKQNGKWVLDTEILEVFLDYI